MCDRTIPQKCYQIKRRWISTVLCPIKVNSNTIEHTVHTSFYYVLDLLCVIHLNGRNFCPGGGSFWGFQEGQRPQNHHETTLKLENTPKTAIFNTGEAATPLPPPPHMNTHIIQSSIQIQAFWEIHNYRKAKSHPHPDIQIQ